MKVTFTKTIERGISTLINEFDKIKTITEDGKIEFEKIKFEELKWILLSHMKFDKCISSINKEYITHRGIERYFESKSSDLLKVIKDEVKSHYSIKQQDYYILTSLSIESLPFSTVNVNSSEIIFAGKKFPEKFDQVRKSIYSINFPKKEENDFLKVIIKIKGDDPFDSCARGLRDLDIFRSFLSFTVNPSISTEFKARYENPINKILCGQFITLHKDSGDSFSPYIHWRNRSKDDEITKYSLSLEERERVEEDVNWYLEKFTRCQKDHKNELEEILIQLVRANDENDKHICFLRGWTIMERLAGTHDNDTLIKRYKAYFHDDIKPIESLKMEGLRSFRNEFVHSGENNLDAHIHAYQVFVCIHRLICFLNMENAGFFKDINESVIFLDHMRKRPNEIMREQEILEKVSLLKPYFVNNVERNS